MSFLRRLFGSNDRSTARPALPANDNVVQVVGESNYQAALEQACNGSSGTGPNRPGVTAELVPEPGNPHDPSAVAVRVNGMTVGYLDRSAAAAYQRRLRELLASGLSLTCAARIKGGYPVPGLSRASFGIELFLAPPEEL